MNVDAGALLAAELRDPGGASVRLRDRLGRGPVVVVFLRHFG